MSDSTYSIIWKHFEKDSDTGKHLQATEAFSLPYFVDGEDKKKFENREPLELNPVHLILGLLVGYFDKPPATDTTFAKDKTKSILHEHLVMFKSPSIEEMLLDFASHLRQSNGSEASLQALMTGVELFPANIDIKYDCCVDLYSCLEDDVLQDKNAGGRKLLDLLNEINPSDLDKQLLEDYNLMKKDVLKFMVS